MQRVLGFDVDPHRGFVDDQDLRLGGEPLGDADLLLVAARERSHRLRQRMRADVELAEGWENRRLLFRACDPLAERAQAPPDRDRCIGTDGVEKDETLLLAVLAHVPEAVLLEGLPEAPDVRYHAPHSNLAAGRLDLTDKRFGQTRTPGSDQAVEAQDLAFS